MRHRIHYKKLNRTSAHRKALQRNLSQSLIEHGSITTTLAKAKDVRPFLEGLITLAVKTRKLSSSDPAASLRARRRIHRLLSDRGMIPADHRSTYAEMSDAARAKTMRMASGRRHRTGEPRGRLAFTAESVVHRLIEHVARGFEDRPGGYTRLIRLPKRRKGDDASLAIVQLVGGEDVPTSLTKPKKTARRRRADARYGVAVKAAKDRAKAQKSAGATKPEPDQDAAAQADQPASGDEQHTNE
ncbi:MAG: 50S ribosomal protein L17 [Planctomycetes bacterium]|nr:50S ribosomal protein L17 [Planctomycetota bacterium]